MQTIGSGSNIINGVINFEQTINFERADRILINFERYS